jgi:hypothetical protein
MNLKLGSKRERAYCSYGNAVRQEESKAVAVLADARDAIGDRDQRASIPF